MKEKEKLLKKVLMSRRKLVATSNIVNGTTLSSGLMELQKINLQLLNQLNLFSALKVSLPTERLMKKKEKMQSYWETYCQSADDTFFKNNFRLNRRLFYKLCKLIPGLQKNKCESISLKEKVAISLYALGSTVEFETIAKMFGIKKANVGKILLSFCTEVWRILAPMYMKNFPLTKSKIETLVEEFETLGFLHCMGVLDYSHIKIKPSHKHSANNYKNKDSVLLLAWVDASYRFIYVSCGSQGNGNISEIYRRSSLREQLDQCELLRGLNNSISEMDVPVFISYDPAFCLNDNIMKPYSSLQMLTHKKEYFNNTLAESHNIAKTAFEQLKFRFRRIGMYIDDSIPNANVIILSCCVLHNFLIENNDIISRKWLSVLEAANDEDTYLGKFN